MPALSSETPASQPGGGGHHPRHVGRRGMPTRPSLPRQRPRLPKEGREWVRWRSRRGKRKADSDCQGDGGVGGWGAVFSFLIFLVCFLVLVHLFLFLCLAELGGRSGSPARTDHSGPVRDLVKGGKLGCCPRGQRQAVAIALRATCSGVARELITHHSSGIPT